jgi:hypothetical protein
MSPEFFENQADVTYAGSLGDVDHLDDIAVRKLCAGADEDVLVGV